MGKVIIDEKTMMRTLARLSHEIIERHPDESELYLVGIRRRGVPLAEIIRKNIEQFSDIRVYSGALDITLYRDDLSERYEEPTVTGSEIDFPVTGRKIILVDDVIFTGRTARAAMEALMSLGRPSGIELLVMVDRGHRELPISANYVGKNIPTSRSEFISVQVDEYDGVNQVVLETAE
ncbi:MAG: bifunctional pyr operon transcriptional regulator/uracil phosphoribosyltransferase PyrR [Lachnospiraceae bacterium]|nr:bifunctional pyr operon transcriptional regulator/uracil phosphoribosyltransferase PyrR [Lachnospiraceae bacterium]